MEWGRRGWDRGKNRKKGGAEGREGIQSVRSRWQRRNVLE
jgi:hypothetical protein